MADYVSTGRTNYFRVIDEEAYKRLYEGISGNYGKLDLSEEKDGVLYHCFGTEGGLFWYDPKDDEPDGNIDYFLEELQKILPDDEAFIYVESGHKKFRYVSGGSWIVTRKHIEWVDLVQVTLEKVREYFGGEFTTQLDY